MAKIVMIGGGAVGLSAAVLVGADGHDVTVLERDPAPAPAPDQAWDTWERRGVNQFRLLHYFQPRYRQIMDDNAPAVVQALRDAGAISLNPLREAPDFVTGGYRPEDARFEAVTARRPVAEAAIASVVATFPNVEVRRGVAVVGFLTGTPIADGVPHVTGVRTDTGDDIEADLVVDVSGRRSNLPGMLADVGAVAPIEEKADCGFVYFGRHFRSGDGSVPMAFGPLLMEHETLSILTLPADNGTWGVGLVASSKDTAMRKLSDLAVWERVMRAHPLVAHWLDGEPLDDDVAVMAKIEDRHRTFVIDGTPVATGVMALADSWACTNPSVGRGITIGTIHALALRDLLRDAPTDPVELARRWHEVTQGDAEQWFRATLDYDQGRLAQIDAALDGTEFQAPMEFEMGRALLSAAGKDPDLLRAYMEIASVLRLGTDVLADPTVFARAIELGQGWRDEALPSPDRSELLALVGA